MARLLSLRKVAVRLDRSLPTLRKWIAAGTFPPPSYDPNGVAFWPEDVIDAWQLLVVKGLFSEWGVKIEPTENGRQRPETTGKSEDDSE